jgi:hypothetical protein
MGDTGAGEDRSPYNATRAEKSLAAWLVEDVTILI